MKKLLRFPAHVIQSLVSFNAFRSPQTHPGWDARYSAASGKQIVLPPKNGGRRKLAR